MTILDAILVLGILGGIGWVIFAKASQKNPKIVEIARSLSPSNLVEKPQSIKDMDKIIQVHDERRTMM